MSESTYYVSKTRRKELLQRYQHKCYLCGDPIALEGSTVDHLIPAAVAKWTDLAPYDINNTINLAICCKTCNRKKNATILTLPQYLKLNIANKEEFKAYYQQCLPYLQQYQELEHYLIEKQEGQCICCSNSLRTPTRNLRRLDHSKPRSRDNASLVCGQSCNHRVNHRNLKAKKEAAKVQENKEKQAV